MNRRMEAILWALLLSLAAALRFYRLGDNPLWLDEANGVLIAWGSPREVVDALTRDGNPPLYYWLLHGWMKIFGASEAGVRGFSALVGTASVAAVGWASRALFPSRPIGALAAGVITALATLHVYYSQEARMYSLTPLLGVGVLVLLHRALESDRAWRWAPVSALLAAGLFTHNYFLFVLPVVPLAALWTPGRRSRARAVALATLAVGVAVLVWSPWIPVLRGQMASGVGAWIPGIWRGTPPEWALVHSFEAMGPGGVFPGYLRELGRLTGELLPEGGWAMVRRVGLVLSLGLVAGGAVRAAQGGDRAAARRTVLLLTVPLALPFAASYVLTPVYLVGRYEMVAFTAFALLAGYGFDELRRVQGFGRGVAVAVAVAWVVSSALGLTAYFGVQGFPHELRVAQWLRGVTGPADVTVFPGYSRAVPEYYLRRWNVPGERVSFPAEVGTHPGWFDAAAALRDRATTDQEAAELAARLRGTLANGGRVFLVDRSTSSQAAEVDGLLRTRLRAALGDPEPGWTAHPERPPSVWVFRGSAE